jgi:hypothetical protein
MRKGFWVVDLKIDTVEMLDLTLLLGLSCAEKLDGPDNLKIEPVQVWVRMC